ncbi:Protein phosphatase PP2A regulatory subunit B [Dimargaris verticillata]|uniref:Polyadenylate-binding protein n=1 Tax=Dimargaris verticillata TaxID=2761393 RepID=A0A9W8AZM9_9FUNG|nr:Protein phosphatase PP2A regulatory subunit B [Dimargaris verticillata]
MSTETAMPSTAAEVAPEVANSVTGADANTGDQAKPEVPQSASLYVGELLPSVTEAVLFELFNMVGLVASIRVCRDAVTRRSLGYAYVNYHNLDDCQRAIDALNYTEIKGKPCRIMWSQRDPSLRRSGSGNIFIKNLDPAIDHKALHDTFAAFGNILSAKVAMKDGASKGYGFVHFEKDESAQSAINTVNGMLLNDKKVFVGRHVPRRERQSKFDEMRSQFTNIFIKNLDAEVDEAELRSLFEPFGEITSVAVGRAPDGRSKGFGFINYAEHEQAVKAVEEMHDKEVREKKLFVSRAQKKQERAEELRRQFEHNRMERMSKYQGVNLYVRNLEDDMDDDKLRQEFSICGDITSAKVMRDEAGKPKGFGFVCFSTPEEATKAVTEMNGRMLGSKPIYVALAQRKEARRRELEARAAQRNQMRMQTGPMPPMPPGAVPAPMYNAPHMYYNNAAAGYPPRGPMPHAYQQPGMGAGPRGNRWNGPNAGAQANPQAMGAPGVPGQYTAMPQSGGYPGAPMAQARPGRGAGGRHGPGRGAAAANAQPRGGYSAAAASGGRGGAAAARGGAKYQGPKHPGSQAAVTGEQSADASSGAAAASGDAPTDKAADSGAAADNGDSALNAAALANANPEDQKMLLGEALYPLIEEREGELAGKITGMLLEMDNSELLHLVENKEARDAKIDEALTVLQQHMKSAGDQ